MEPKLFARTIVSLEDKYGLRLDAQDAWLRLDDWKRLGPNQMGKPCGRGWVGLRGACKRGKKGDDNTATIKASKVALADKIRAKKGLRDRNDPKIEQPAPSTRTKAKAVKTTTKKTSAADVTREEISALTKTDIGKSIITAIAESGEMSSTTVSRKTGYKAMHFVEGENGVDMEREASKTIQTLRNKIYPDLEDPQILKKLKKTVTAEDRQRLVKNNLVHRSGYSEEQAEWEMSKTSRTDSERRQ